MLGKKMLMEACPEVNQIRNSLKTHEKQHEKEAHFLKELKNGLRLGNGKEDFIIVMNPKG